MKLSRILAILCLLMEGPKSVEQIIDALSNDYRFDWRAFSKETIYRDIRHLKDAGFEVDYSKRTGNYSLKAAPVCIKLEPAEIIALAVVCSSVVGQVGLPYSSELTSALDKISNLLVPASKKSLTTEPHFKIKLDLATDYSKYQKTIEIIRRAIASDNEIEILYYSAKSNREDTRVVDPYDLYYSDGGIRLEGYCYKRQKVLEFRVDRIREIKILPTKIGRPSADESFEFKLWLDQKLTRFIGEHFIDQKIEKNPDGTSILTGKANSPFRLILQVLKYGERAKLLEPEDLRKEMAKIAKQMYELYSYSEESDF